MQNITLSNLLNRSESFNFCTYAETIENYETLTELHLPQKLKFWKERKFTNFTLKDPISNTNPNKIKLPMLQEGLKGKQLEKKINTKKAWNKQLQSWP